jgi:energy-coupling factor transport system ATP-binding protein
MDEVVNANKVAVLSNGELVMEGTPAEIFKRQGELKEYGLDVPRATKIANALKENGLPIKDGILTAEGLAEELCRLFQKA